MKQRYRLLALSVTLGGLCAGLLLVGGRQALVASADSTYQTLPFAQDWPHSGLIVNNDDWSGVPGILGYNGASSGVVGEAVDPQTVLSNTVIPADLDVTANLIGPSGNTTDTVAEFEAHPSVDNNRVVALRAQTAYPAPFLLLHFNTTGLKNITVHYNVRDIDTSGRNAAQQVALHFRTGGSGSFTNVPGGYIADATIVNATMVTAVNVVLPAAANNQALLQLRILTTNAVGGDEWVGIDDISVSGIPLNAVENKLFLPLITK